MAAIVFADDLLDKEERNMTAANKNRLENSTKRLTFSFPKVKKI